MKFNLFDGLRLFNETSIICDCIIRKSAYRFHVVFTTTMVSNFGTFRLQFGCRWHNPVFGLIELQTVATFVVTIFFHSTRCDREQKKKKKEKKGNNKLKHM